MAMPLGRKSPSNKPALRLGSFLKAQAVPTFADHADYLASYSGWAMLGNNKYGDCVAVASANNRAEITTVLTGKTHYPTLDDVLAFYRTQNPNFPEQDEGMDMQTACESLISVGIGGTKALAFAKVDHTNHDQLMAAIAIFGSVLLGVNVADAQQDQFSAGKPWDYVAGSPIEGGHAIHTGGYAHSDTSKELHSITWAQEISLTDRFWVHQVEEAWVVIWPEHLASKTFVDSMDLTALAADYQQLTGRQFPGVAPAPSPAPAPVPAPGPVASADAVLAGAARDWLASKHSGANKTMAKSLQVWLKAKDL